VRRSMGWPLWAPAAKDWGSAWRRMRLRRAPHEDLPVRATAVVLAVEAPAVEVEVVARVSRS